MKRQVLSTPAAPAAIGTYSQGIRAGNLLFLSGQIPLDPATGALVDGGAEPQIRRAFANVEALLSAAGTTSRCVVKLTVFLTDLAHFPAVNAIMPEFFTAPFPARSAVGVASLPRGALVEVEAIAHLD